MSTSTLIGKCPDPVKWIVAKASRDTASGRFIAEIDGLRFIAIFSVILFHLSGYVANKTGRAAVSDPLGTLLSHGHVGVQLFFVISGAVIALPFAKAYFTGGSTPRLAQYFTRRLTRLEPPYILNLLILYGILILGTGETADNLLPHLFSSMTYLHNIIYGRGSVINVVAWSLEVELQFYVLAPVLTRIFVVRPKAVRRVLIIGLIALISLLNLLIPESARFRLSICSQAHYFLTGFLLIDLYVTEWEKKPGKSLLWDCISAAAWCLIWVLLSLGRGAEALLVAPIFFAYCGAFRGTWSNRFFNHPLVYTVGGMCYTLYLYHYQIISAFGRLLLKTRVLEHLPLWLAIITAILVIIPVIVTISTCLFILVEKPCMKRDWYLCLVERLRLRPKAYGESEPPL